MSGLPGFGTRDSVTKAGHQLDYVDMVNPLFQDTFAVYSDDQVEARTLIHPSYLERLVEIERAFFGEKVRALFHEGWVVIAIESGNLFESGGLDAERDRNRVQEAANQFSALARLAVAFNQDERGRRLSD